MACLHHRAKPTQDGNVIYPDCGRSMPAGFRAPNSFVPAPATTLDVTGISIGVGFGTLLGGSYLALGWGGFAGAVVLFGQLVARAAGF